MLKAVALLSLLGWATLLAAIIAHVVDGLERRRLGRVVAEIAVTEAVHGVLGAIVVPTVRDVAASPGPSRSVSRPETSRWPVA
jgi:hypothetical protein